MDTLGRTKESPLLIHFLCQGSHWETVNVERMQHPSCHFIISTMLSLVGFLSHRLVLSLARRGDERGTGDIGLFCCSPGHTGTPRESQGFREPDSGLSAQKHSAAMFTIPSPTSHGGTGKCSWFSAEIHVGGQANYTASQGPQICLWFLLPSLFPLLLSVK